MANLLASQIKKGDTVYQYGAWNFISFGIERGNHFHRDERGRGVYTPRTIDQAYIRKHVVHSCGKKRMYLMAEDGKSRGKEFWVQESGAFGNFTSTHEEAVENLKELFAADTMLKVPYEILTIN